MISKLEYEILNAIHTMEEYPRLDSIRDVINRKKIRGYNLHRVAKTINAVHRKGFIDYLMPTLGRTWLICYVTPNGLMEMGEYSAHRQSIIARRKLFLTVALILVFAFTIWLMRGGR